MSTPTFSDRERAIIPLIAVGLTNSAIGRKLFCAEATVKSHVKHIFRKAGVNGRAAFVNWAWQHGVVGDRAELALEVVALRNKLAGVSDG